MILLFVLTYHFMSFNLTKAFIFVGHILMPSFTINQFGLIHKLVAVIEVSINWDLPGFGFVERSTAFNLG